MRNKNDCIGKCEKRMFTKHRGVCKTYSVLQTKYAEILENDPTVKEFATNIPLKGTTYTTDFYITNADGTVMVRECILHLDLVKPRWLALLEYSVPN